METGNTPRLAVMGNNRIGMANSTTFRAAYEAFLDAALNEE